MPKKVKKIKKFRIPKSLEIKKNAIEQIGNLKVAEFVKRGKKFYTIDIAREITNELERLDLMEASVLIHMNMFVITILKEKFGESILGG